MEETFGTYGTITSSVIMTDKQDRKFAFVNFENTEAAQKCVEEATTKKVEASCCEIGAVPVYADESGRIACDNSAKLGGGLENPPVGVAQAPQEERRPPQAGASTLEIVGGAALGALVMGVISISAACYYVKKVKPPAPVVITNGAGGSPQVSVVGMPMGPAGNGQQPTPESGFFKQGQSGKGGPGAGGSIVKA